MFGTQSLRRPHSFWSRKTPLGALYCLRRQGSGTLPEELSSASIDRFPRLLHAKRLTSRQAFLQSPKPLPVRRFSPARFIRRNDAALSSTASASVDKRYSLDAANMESPIKYSPLPFQHAVVAYLLAVTSATLAFTLPQLLFEIPNILAGTGFESATTLDPLIKIQHLSIMTLILFVIGWIFSFFSALIPFAAGITIARQFKISHWSYFVLGGALTAMALEPLFIAIPNLGINVQEPEPSFGQKYLTGLRYFLVAGTVAGITCYMYLRRAVRR